MFKVWIKIKWKIVNSNLRHNTSNVLTIITTRKFNLLTNPSQNHNQKIQAVFVHLHQHWNLHMKIKSIKL
jgi:hypothetical protein